MILSIRAKREDFFIYPILSYPNRISSIRAKREDILLMLPYPILIPFWLAQLRRARRKLLTTRAKREERFVSYLTPILSCLFAQSAKNISSYLNLPYLSLILYDLIDSREARRIFLSILSCPNGILSIRAKREDILLMLSCPILIPP